MRGEWKSLCKFICKYMWVVSLRGIANRLALLDFIMQKSRGATILLACLIDRDGLSRRQYALIADKGLIKKA